MHVRQSVNPPLVFITVQMILSVGLKKWVVELSASLEQCRDGARHELVSRECYQLSGGFVQTSEVFDRQGAVRCAI